MTNFGLETEEMVRKASNLGNLTAETLHKIIFCSFVKAGLSIYGAAKKQEAELENLTATLPPPYRGLINGKLYLSALCFIRKFKKLLRNSRPVILKEANLQHIVQFLEEKVGKVDAVFVLDCASVPEIITIASKFTSLRKNITIFEEVFVNPIGMTRFLTEQLETFNREGYLRQYAELLKERLEAKFFIKSSTIDIITHRYGFSVDSFLRSINMQQLFDQINHFAKQSSVLVTSDHGYDVVADEHGLYITHGYKEECPVNFSRLALFLVID
jgi:hypothetical protein